jgi:hypothetical protein
VLLKYEDSERFKHIMDILDRWDVPKLPVGKENRVKGYIVLKLEEVRDFLGRVAADLLYDVLLSDVRIKSLEERGWEVEAINASPWLYALWLIGVGSTVRNKLSEMREKYKSMVQEVSKEKDKGKGEK